VARDEKKKTGDGDDDNILQWAIAVFKTPWSIFIKI